MVANAPVNAGARDPAADFRQVGVADAEARRHGRCPEGCHHKAHGVARAGQGQEIKERPHCRAVAPTQTADVERDGADGIEHGLDCGGVFVHVGRQHQNICWLDVVVGVEQAKQAVVQDFRFAGSGMADVNLHGIVLGDIGLDGLDGKAKVEDVLLYASEAGGGRGLGIGFVRCAHAEIVCEQCLHVAGGTPPGRQ